MTARLPAIERVMRRVTIDQNGCWIWTGKIETTGYGRILGDEVDGKRPTVMVHRVTYEHHKGPIPPGDGRNGQMVLDHLCRVRACCNPNHLEPVSVGENCRRGIRWQALKTHCPRGHPYDETNTHYNGKGRRWCKACWRRKNELRSTRGRAKLESPPRSHCAHGHELTPENFYASPNGAWACRACNRISDAKRAQSKARDRAVPV